MTKEELEHLVTEAADLAVDKYSDRLAGDIKNIKTDITEIKIKVDNLEKRANTHDTILAVLTERTDAIKENCSDHKKRNWAVVILALGCALNAIWGWIVGK